MLSGTFLAAFASRAEDDVMIAIAIAIAIGVGVAEKLRVGTTVDRLVRGSMRARLRNMVVA